MVAATRCVASGVARKEKPMIITKTGDLPCYPSVSRARVRRLAANEKPPGPPEGAGRQKEGAASGLLGTQFSYYVATPCTRLLALPFSDG
jgi:hypothetical protein